MPWSIRALESIEWENISGIGGRYALPALLRVCVAMRRSVEDHATKIVAEKKHFAAITPSGYFKLLSLLQTQIEQRRQASAAQIARYETGVEKIQAMHYQIAEMIEQIDRDIPVLETTHREIERMFVELTAKRGEVKSTAAAV
jgi:hypothetical protein